jgi:hypothetical protein
MVVTIYFGGGITTQTEQYNGIFKRWKLPVRILG